MIRLFVWLDHFDNDFHQFRQRFSRQINSNVYQWFFFSNDDDCRQFIQKAISLTREIIFITSGRLGIDLIEHFHHHQQIHSIYIYCENTCKYKRFAQSYRKILGIFSNPNELLKTLIENLSKENRKNEEKFSFDPQLTIWNPWSNEFPTLKLPDDDPLIISIVQTTSIPFKIVFSSVDQINEISHRDKFSLHFDLDRSSATIGTHLNGRVKLLSSTRQIDEILQPNENQRELHYWIVLAKKQSKIFFGLGEIRLGFEILHAEFSVDEQIFVSQLSNLHFCLNGFWKNFSQIENFQNEIRFSYGSFRLNDPDLFIRTRRKLDGSPMEMFYSGLTFEMLSSSLQTIYHQMNNFKLLDHDFPQIISAIELSCRHSHGWCHQILRKNSSKINSIRLKKNSLIIEIFPPTFSTSIRHYRNAAGFIRVLYGSIFIRLFHFLTRNSSSSKSPKEFLLHKDETTWTLPHWNQTQQMKNIELNSLSIVLQIFQSNLHDGDEFDELDFDSRTIRRRTNSFDLSFDEFKEKMQKEWNEQHL